MTVLVAGTTDHSFNFYGQQYICVHDTP